MNEHDDDPFDDDVGIDDGADTSYAEPDPAPDSTSGNRTRSARQRLEERRESRWLKEMTSDWDSWDDNQVSR